MTTGMPDIQKVLSKGFFSMVFQPIIKTTSMDFYGFEALLRGAKGTALENPSKVFHEETLLNDNFLIEIDLACIGSAIRTGRNFPEKCKLFINIHGKTLKRLYNNFDAFLNLLNELNVDPRRIVLEISEKTDGNDIEALSKAVSMFKELGFQIALDDVGILSPWLYHILWLKPDYIKIDRSFVSGLDTDQGKKELVAGLVEMNKAMDISLIAEGVEEDEELNILGELNVTFGQGYFIGRPGTAEKWLSSIRDGNGKNSTVPAFTNNVLNTNK